MNSLKHARMVLLAKSDISIQIIPETDNKDAAMIWCKVGHSKRDRLVIGGIYRQFQLLW